jgi:hypothetical protein
MKSLWWKDIYIANGLRRRFCSCKDPHGSPENNRTRAAEVLAISLKTLFNKLKSTEQPKPKATSQSKSKLAVRFFTPSQKKGRNFFFEA